LRELCELHQQGGVKLVWARFDQIRHPSSTSETANPGQTSAESPSET
jgi:hypothetical protein